MANEALLVFAHLRKTAGTTVCYIMRRQFRRGETIRIDAPTVAAANAQWNAMTAERRAAVKCVHGHFPYAPELFAPRRITCFTILRDPVERVVSEYYFNLRNPDETLHAALNRERITLDRFVNSAISAEVHNTQTRMLAGAPADAASGELLELAQTNLRERLALAGISERLDASLLLCREILGWRRLVYRRINVNRWRPAVDTLSSGTVAAIERANSLDRELYRSACARFDELLREHRITQAETKALRRMSTAYGFGRRALGMPREIWIEARTALARRRVASGSQP